MMNGLSTSPIQLIALPEEKPDNTHLTPCCATSHIFHDVENMSDKSDVIKDNDWVIDVSEDDEICSKIVYVDLSGVVEQNLLNTGTRVKVLGLENNFDKGVLMQIGSAVFEGKFGNTLGTMLFFEDANAVQQYYMKNNENKASGTSSESFQPILHPCGVLNPESFNSQVCTNYSFINKTDKQFRMQRTFLSQEKLILTEKIKHSVDEDASL